MGCTSSQESEKSKEISMDLKKERKKISKEIKLLLLGAGESGKSTIVKQMKIIYLSGFNQEELANYKPIVHANAIEAIKLLVNACKEFGYDLEKSNKKTAKSYYDIDAYGTQMTVDVKNEIKVLWNDTSVQKAWKRNGEFHLNDSSGYFLDSLERISSAEYIPTVEDVLKSRSRTTGIHEMEFVVGKLNFKMLDVGGQRTERKKWIHCFQDVTALIFVVAINEYDLRLYEDENVNRMDEAIQLFDEICNSQWFQNSYMILFLNKKDLFEEKIKEVDLNVCFEDYKDGKDFKAASKFIKNKFIKLNKQEDKPIYVHFTCATDTENIRYVFDVVKDIIMNNRIDEVGF
eukprot:TRINITY_DN613_c1_g1_i1.p1 TRINITY_DN613_c1_g1~~TRINITY_DN613_c1_g1_i1.p1  ORF type:complete len:346 (-),score=84.22 TRINITY_DN613_c1_g1_i1:147-1184(-)